MLKLLKNYIILCNFQCLNGEYITIKLVCFTLYSKIQIFSFMNSQNHNPLEM